MFELDGRWTVDGSSRRNVARYANHSCRPNAESDVVKGKVILRAIRNIRPGDEITYDYGEEYFELFLHLPDASASSARCSGAQSATRHADASTPSGQAALPAVRQRAVRSPRRDSIAGPQLRPPAPGNRRPCGSRSWHWRARRRRPPGRGRRRASPHWRPGGRDRLGTLVPVRRFRIVHGSRRHGRQEASASPTQRRRCGPSPRHRLLHHGDELLEGERLGQEIELLRSGTLLSNASSA